MSRLAVNLRVVAALGAPLGAARPSAARSWSRRSSSSPPCCSRSRPGGAGGAVDLPGFPQVDGFLDFMLAGAMVQSCLLAGNSGGIALAVDLEMGFTDRLLAAPISRFAIVLGRLAGTAALGAVTAVWFIAIGLIFGATIEGGVAGAILLMIAARRRSRRSPSAGIGAAIALYDRQGLGRPGPVPAGVRDPVPLQRLLPGEPDARAGGDGRRVQPALASSSTGSASR